MPAEILGTLRHITLGDFLDIVLVAFILYSFLRLIKDTKAYQMAIGLGLVGMLFLITEWGKLSVSNRIIRSFINYFIILIIVLFQAEIRRFLTGIGSRSLRRPFSFRSLQEKMDDLFRALDYMSQRRIGALIAVEKEISLASYAQRGTAVNALLSKDLLVSLFFPHSPLHDGAVIIRGDTITAAGCLLPLPATHKLSGPIVTRTRHLAAVGLSMETDAAVIVVSEETGTISLAVRGTIEKFEDSGRMRERLVKYLRNTR
jgi:diadenylate cyclase